MNGSSFNMNELRKAIELLDGAASNFESKELDEMMKVAGDIKNVLMVTSLSELEDTSCLKTRYGNLRVIFNRYLPKETSYLVRNTPIDDLTWTNEEDTP